ncbi:MAG: hypothetical protein ACRDG7_03935 [Candidatus Limnocylindria bacterium]
MRRWREAAVDAARFVSARPELWLPGALAWLSSVGWLPLIVAVARPPSVAELTFLGARIVTSGAWPWNAVLIGAVIVTIVLAAFALTAIANAVLIALLERRAPASSDAARLLAVNLVAALPAVFAMLAVLLAAAVIAPREFNAPDPASGPVLRTIAMLTPYLVLLGVTAMAGGALAAVAGRLALRARGGIAMALRSAPSVTLGASPTTHAIAACAVQLAFLGSATLLLAVLWAPIGDRLDGGGEIEVAVGLLLVGFVAIWLCLVLAGGALHAWSAATWSRLIATDASGRT